MPASLFKKKKAPEASLPQRRYIQVIEAEPDFGLTAAEARARLDAGYGNKPAEPPVKSNGRIIREHTLTYFNLIFAILGAVVIAVGRFRELTFLFVVIVNLVIGVVQEIRSKKALDRLHLLMVPRCRAVRSGQIIELPASELVRDDIVIFSSGEQICADGVVLTGAAHLNEALVTGEADDVEKNPGDQLISGSFVVTGEVRARLTAVGAESFASKLTNEAKAAGKMSRGQMMISLSRLVQVVGIVLIPVAILLYLNQTRVIGLEKTDAVVTTVGALVGMIPEGLYLLTTLALTVGVLKLARRKVLVHNLASIEMLARADVLCVDKTGTITDEKMTLSSIEPTGCGDVDSLKKRLADYAAAQQDANASLSAIRAALESEGVQAENRAFRAVPFTSQVKYGAAAFPYGATLLGAPEMLLPEGHPMLARAQELAAGGLRVLAVCARKGLPEEGRPCDVNENEALGLVTLANSIRESAPATFDWFASQGVAVKVISGDNPATVAEVARRAHIPNADKYIDMRTVTNERALRRAAEEYTVFGRVTPDQKRRLIKAMKAAGHTVAMTGDGVNDVLALKAADCGVAMASGSDVSSRVSHIVLLNSDFSSLPSVVAEGRQVINNIERSASLFLVKNIFSMILTILSIALGFAYPISPSQISLVSLIVLSVPTFVLALEPNSAPIRGAFLPNVIRRALPGALAAVSVVLGFILYSETFGFSAVPGVSTGATLLLLAVGFIMLARCCVPMTKIRAALCIFVAVMTFVCLRFFSWFFSLEPLGKTVGLLFALFLALAYPVTAFFSWLLKLVFELLSRGKKNKAK